MTATVVWSPNLRLAFKDMKTISSRDILLKQVITASERQAIQKQLLNDSKKDVRNWYWA